MPAIASSDHCAIVLSQKALQAVGGSRRINVIKRSNSSNGRNLLAHALANHDWQPLYYLTALMLKLITLMKL
jgi:hypothetical protein